MAVFIIRRTPAGRDDDLVNGRKEMSEWKKRRRGRGEGDMDGHGVRAVFPIKVTHKARAFLPLNRLEVIFHQCYSFCATELVMRSLSKAEYSLKVVKFNCKSSWW